MCILVSQKGCHKLVHSSPAGCKVKEFFVIKSKCDWSVNRNLIDQNKLALLMDMFW